MNIASPPTNLNLHMYIEEMDSSNIKLETILRSENEMLLQIEKPFQVHNHTIIICSFVAKCAKT